MDDAIEELTIVALDARGEGVADSGASVPFALPGERVRALRAGRRAELVEVLSPSDERARPFCAWFGRCGGCIAQHMSPELYRGWKRQQVVDALASAGVEAEVGPLVDAHGEGRRRAAFHARFPHAGADEVGFMRARSHEIVAIDGCPLFAPAMSGALEAARALAGDLRGLMKPLDIWVTATLAGLDVDLRGCGPLAAAETQKLIRTAARLDLARLANHGAIVVERRSPRVRSGEALLAPPPGGFLQATQAGEDRLAEFAQSALGKARKVADLFCGAGAFALRLARTHEVFAADSDPDAIAALKRGAADAPGLRGVTAETRDLFHRPLSAAELEPFDAALFDPPRAGAEAQARAFAMSRLPLVVAISCNAGTFARDARILIEGGFAIDRVTPLDQFRASPHVEIAAVFRRKAKRPIRRVFG